MNKSCEGKLAPFKNSAKKKKKTKKKKKKPKSKMSVKKLHCTALIH